MTFVLVWDGGVCDTRIPYNERRVYVRGLCGLDAMILNRNTPGEDISAQSSSFACVGLCIANVYTCHVPYEGIRIVSAVSFSSPKRPDYILTRV